MIDLTQSVTVAPVLPPRVSIVCAFYNGANFLSAAVESVLAQDFSDFELLLVDDGSSDGSSEIARMYADLCPDKIRYLEHSGHVNRGAGPSRNLGLRQSEGEFVAIIDADDVWRPHKLREQISILEANPDAGMVCGTVNYWSSWAGGEDKLVGTGDRRDALSRPPETLLRLYPLGSADAPCPSDLMIRRQVFEAGCTFDEDFSGPVQMYEDQTFLVKVYLNWPVYFSTGVWLDYRQHPESCVSTVVREGFYPRMRWQFLEWLAGYVAQGDFKGRDAILRSIDRAKWVLRHPRMGRLLQRTKSAFRILRH